MLQMYRPNYQGGGMGYHPPQGPWQTPTLFSQPQVGPGFGNDMRVPGQPQGPSGPNGPVQRPSAGGYQRPPLSQFQQPQQQQPQSLLGNVTGTIQPMSLFTPQMTNQAANLAQADYERAASPNYLLKQFDRPGVSRSAGSMSAAIPLMAQLRGQGALEAANVRAGDEQANRQSMLQGQQAQNAEGMGLFQLLSLIQNQGRANEFNSFQNGLGLLRGLL